MKKIQKKFQKQTNNISSEEFHKTDENKVTLPKLYKKYSRNKQIIFRQRNFIKLMKIKSHSLNFLKPEKTFVPQR